MDKDTIQKMPSLSSILRPYENKWVALSSNKKHVLSSGNTLKEAATHLGAQEKSSAIFMKVSAADQTFSPIVL